MTDKKNRGNFYLFFAIFENITASNSGTLSIENRYQIIETWLLLTLVLCLSITSCLSFIYRSPVRELQKNRVH